MMQEAPSIPLADLYPLHSFWTATTLPRTLSLIFFLAPFITERFGVFQGRMLGENSSSSAHSHQEVGLLVLEYPKLYYNQGLDSREQCHSQAHKYDS